MITHKSAYAHDTEQTTKTRSIQVPAI